MIRRIPRLGVARSIGRWSSGWMLSAEWLGVVVELRIMRRLSRPQPRKR